MNIGIITLFPEMFNALQFGIVGRAQKNNLLNIQYINPRNYSQDKHHTVDDTPYGGGPGMVMKIEPLVAAIKAAKESIEANAPIIYLSPQGKPLKQSMVASIAKEQSFILLSGRYEGIDQRIIDHYIDAEWSMGDYVLSGGEFPAMVVVDCVTRLLPGALGDEKSAMQDSFENELLDFPHYTRPQNYLGMHVPDILLSGDHQAIANWRLKQALGKTWRIRPDLLEKRDLNELEKKLLTDFITEYQGGVTS
jgi:tRNA (guanine37-N1)-methyltransferase